MKEAQNRRLWFQVGQGKNVCEIPSQWLLCHTFIIPATVGSINRRIDVQAGQDKSMTPISKITRAKRAGDMTQEVECLPS
jgi:hypothetical protein